MNDYLIIITLCLLAIIVFFLACSVFYLHHVELALKQVTKEIKGLRIQS